MHSSRMRTARSSSRRGVYLVLRGVPSLGGCLLGGCTWSWAGVPGQRGCLLWGRVYLVPGVGGCTWSWGVYLVLRGVPGLMGGVPGPGGVPGLGGCLLPWGCTWFLGGVPGLEGVSAPGGCLLPGGVPGQVLPPCGQTHACKHITLPQTSFVGGSNRLAPELRLGKPGSTTAASEGIFKS